ncbi:MAG: CYTH domain-containing protein [Muribaculaceae bacterium]|nr:CYTH domain-containing protein [Muribaculaceae bacterium]
MGFETERKYLVKDESYRNLAFKSSVIAQGYLNRDPERTVRIRIKDDRGFLTVKGKNTGDTRLEFEYEIPLDDARTMLGLCDGSVVEKIRYYVNYSGFVWEVDEFQGRNASLVVAEIELPSSDVDFDVPDFIGAEVTGDPNYYNSNLS